jgi:hypothetical protein
MPKSEKDITNRETSNANLKPGRRKGSKNKSTLFKQAMKEGFENLLELEGVNVFKAVVEQAKEGNMAAAKLILDRVMPVADQAGTKGAGTTQVVINVEGMQATVGVMDEQPITDIEFEEVDD